jgi:predicted patatin/cPLA2 family phospholipase
VICIIINVKRAKLSLVEYIARTNKDIEYMERKRLIHEKKKYNFDFIFTDTVCKMSFIKKRKLKLEKKRQRKKHPY